MARNTGFDAAGGDYIMFFDSDDWIEPDTLQAVYDNAVNNNADVVVFGYFQDNQKDDDEVEPGIIVKPSEKLLFGKYDVKCYLPVMDREKVLVCV